MRVSAHACLRLCVCAKNIWNKRSRITAKFTLMTDSGWKTFLEHHTHLAHTHTYAHSTHHMAVVQQHQQQPAHIVTHNEMNVYRPIRNVVLKVLNLCTLYSLGCLYRSLYGIYACIVCVCVPCVQCACIFKRTLILLHAHNHNAVRCYLHYSACVLSDAAKSAQLFGNVTLRVEYIYMTETDLRYFETTNISGIGIMIFEHFISLSFGRISFVIKHLSKRKQKIILIQINKQDRAFNAI